MQAITKMVRKPQFPLQQVIRRLSEKEAHVKVQPNEHDEVTLKKEHWDGPVPDGFCDAKSYIPGI